MKRNTDLDFIRAILIVLMILIHIVSFGNAYPQLKAGILSFMMPTFLIITGYLVNIEKTGRQMGNYLKCLALPYVIMVTGFSVLSYYMPVRDGITELSLSQIGEKIFVTSIGPYWFIQTMIICGTLYYFCFSGRNWNDLRKNYTKRDTYASLFVFAVTLLLISETPALSASAAAYLPLPPHLYDGCEVLPSPLQLGSERDFVCSLHRDTRHPGKYRHRQNHGKDQAGLPLRKGKDIKIIQ